MQHIWLKARHLSPDSPVHFPPPAQPIHSTVTLKISNVPMQTEVVLRDRRRDFNWRVEMTPQESNVHTATITMPSAATIIYYHFEFADGSILQEHRQFDDHHRPVYDQYEDRDFQIAVYDPDAMPADWTQGMLIYQIFPDSFARGRDEITRSQYGPYGHELLIKNWNDPPELPPVGRDYYGGDFRGVIEKLDYLQELGIECIYFCPVFQSPSNHRYDTFDYMKIDPMLGTEDDFVEMVEAAHERGIKIILDAVFNHCSCDSIYFDMPGRYDGAYHNKQSPYYRWFHFERWPDEYQMWHDIRNMPEFVECPEVEAFFLGGAGVTAYWLQLGIDGWRTDVTSCNSDTFWRRFRDRINQIRPDAYLVSEEWGNASHYLVGDMFSATMNYRFTFALEGFFAVERLNAAQLEDRLATLRRDTPAPALHAQMNLLSSHDIRRILTACDGDKQRMKQIVAFQMSYPGAPMIYYGDEAGLTGASAEDGRKAYPWGHEDAEILAFYKNIMAVRQRLPVLRTGDYETLAVDDERRLFAFARRLDDTVIYSLFNAGDQPATFELPAEAGNWIDGLGLNGEVLVENSTLTVEIPARGMAWYIRAS